jgi:tetratricopeptide (TPR) repeat protein
VGPLKQQIRLRSRSATFDRATILSELGVLDGRVEGIEGMGASNGDWGQVARDLKVRLLAVNEPEELRRLGRAFRQLSELRHARVALELAAAKVSHSPYDAHIRASIIADLADTLRHMGDLYEAWRLLGISIRTLRSQAQRHSTDFLAALNNRAEIALALGKYADAELRLREIVRENTAQNDPESPSVLSAQNNLAQALVGQHRFEESIEIHRGVLVIRIRTLGRRASDTSVSMWNLALALAKSGHLDEAESIMAGLRWLMSDGPERMDSLTLEQRRIRVHLEDVKANGLVEHAARQSVRVSGLLRLSDES